MVSTTINLDQRDVEKAVAFWVESGMPEPKQKASVLFHYDPPTGHPTDPGAGVTASVTGGKPRC